VHTWILRPLPVPKIRFTTLNPKFIRKPNEFDLHNCIITATSIRIELITSYPKILYNVIIWKESENQTWTNINRKIRTEVKVYSATQANKLVVTTVYFIQMKTVFSTHSNQKALKYNHVRNVARRRLKPKSYHSPKKGNIRYPIIPRPRHRKQLLKTTFVNK
jgi:hypothetical protein